MRKRVPHACGERGCPNLVYGRDRYCPEHAPKHAKEEWEKRKENGTAVKYGSEWNKISKDFLRAYPYCAICGKRSEVVHHKLPRSAGGSDSPDNLVALCRACHTALHNKTIRGNKIYAYK